MCFCDSWLCFGDLRVGTWVPSQESVKTKLVALVAVVAIVAIVALVAFLTDRKEEVMSGKKTSYC